jgi:hypothetical protein
MILSGKTHDEGVWQELSGTFGPLQGVPRGTYDRVCRRPRRRSVDNLWKTILEKSYNYHYVK